MVKKYWTGGKTGDTTNYANDENWAPVSIRNTDVQWTASSSGTSEYYLQVSGGGNPATGELSGLVQPDAVYESGTALTAATAGSLTASQWAWADNDTLGYSTIYVRTSGSVDPDSLALDAITFTDTPNANDTVYIGPKVVSGTATSYNIDTGLDASNIELDDFIVLPTYTGKIGLANAYLQIDMADTDVFRFAGRGLSYINVGTAAIDPVIAQTANAASGVAGLYLKGSAIDSLSIEAGSVELVGATVTAAEVRSGASLTIDQDSTVTTLNTSGTVTHNGASTTVNVYEGVTTINGTDAMTIVQEGGTVYNDGTGTKTVTTYGGVFNSERNGAAKTVNLTYNGGDLRIGSNVTFTGTYNTGARITEA